MHIHQSCCFLAIVTIHHPRPVLHGLADELGIESYGCTILADALKQEEEWPMQETEHLIHLMEDLDLDCCLSDISHCLFRCRDPG